jgi:methylmalonyl-CoA mutase, C-terminal domain
MSAGTVRILMAKLGEGYEAAVTRLALAFREAGYEVIFTDDQRPEAIVTSAIQEAVDHIGITVLPGAVAGDIIRIIDMLKEEGMENVRITAGGFMEVENIGKIKAAGVVEFFARGTTIMELIAWAKDHIRRID